MQENGPFWPFFMLSLDSNGYYSPMFGQKQTKMTIFEVISLAVFAKAMLWQHRFFGDDVLFFRIWGGFIF